VGPKVGLDRCGKSRPALGFDPRTFQSVANIYSLYATRPTFVQYCARIVLCMISRTLSFPFTDRLVYAGHCDWQEVNVTCFEVLIEFLRRNVNVNSFGTDTVIREGRETHGQKGLAGKRTALLNFKVLD